MSKFDDKTFREHSKWLAFQQSSLTWPKYWRAVIFKLDRVTLPDTYETKYVVLPRNPEYDKYMNDESAHAMLVDKTRHIVVDDVVVTLPPMHLGPAEFDTLEDIDQWAQVAWRMR